MAWSDAARATAAEARRQHAFFKQRKVTKFAVTGPFPIGWAGGVVLNVSTKRFRGKTPTAATKRAVRYVNLKSARYSGR